MTPEFEERRKQSIWERIEEVGQEYRTGHKAHRTRIEQLEHQVDALADDLKTLTATMERFASAPVEATKLRFSPQVLVVIFSVTFMLVGAIYGFNNRVLVRFDQLEAERAATAKLNDERMARMSKDIADVKAQQTMQDLKITNLRETLLARGGK